MNVNRIKLYFSALVIPGAAALYIAAFSGNDGNGESYFNRNFFGSNNSSMLFRINEELHPFLYGRDGDADLEKDIVFDRACPRLYQKDQSAHSRVDLLLAVQDASEKFQVESELVLAVIAVESRCNPHARSGAGALGLMQLMPDTARSLGVQDPLSVRDNVFGGAKYLSMLVERFDGNLDMALAAYNIGPVLVERHKRVPSVKETQNFVKKVLSYYHALIDFTDQQQAESAASRA